MSTEHEIRPFRIDIPQADLDDLGDRLARTRWAGRAARRGPWARGVPRVLPRGPGRATGPRPTTGASTRPGSTSSPSSPPRSTARTSTSCTCARPRPDALPLIVTHGWPGLGRRVPRRDRSAHRPARPRRRPGGRLPPGRPVDPGFGFSAPLAEAGWTPTASPRRFVELMSRLGYERYGAQGGDYRRRRVAGRSGALDADHVVGVHVNAATAGFMSLRARRATTTWPSSPTWRRPGSGRLQNYMNEQMGYMHAAVDPSADAGLRPDRLAGRAARLDRREVQGVDRRRGRPARGRGRPRPPAHQRDAVLADRHGRIVGQPVLRGRPRRRRRLGPDDRAQPACPPAWRRSARTSPSGATPRRPTPSPTGPTSPTGGHFAAMEAPELFVGDVREFFRTVR